MMKELLLIGGGGHCRSVIDVIECANEYKIVGIVEKDHSVDNICGYDVIGTDDQLKALIGQYGHILVTVGQIKTADIRKQLFEKSKRFGALLPVIVSPAAYISRHATVKFGSVVMHGAIVNTCAIIGSNCIINSKCLIEHDTSVGSHCHVSTGAIINGNCLVGEGSFIGSGAVIKNNVTIGANSLIGAGVTVLHDLPSKSVVRYNDL